MSKQRGQGTHPYPLDLPVVGSVTTKHDLMGPTLSNTPSRSADVHPKSRFRTNRPRSDASPAAPPPPSGPLPPIVEGATRSLLSWPGLVDTCDPYATRKAFTVTQSVACVGPPSALPALADTLASVKKRYGLSKLTRAHPRVFVCWTLVGAQSAVV